MPLVKPKGNMIVGKIQSTLYDFHVTILEGLLFLAVIGPAIVLRVGFLSQESNASFITDCDIIRENENIHALRANDFKKVSIEDYYMLDYSTLFQCDTLNFIFAVTFAPIMMLMVCIEHEASLEESFVSQVKRHCGRVFRYYFVFLMGVVCLSLTIDVIKLSANNNPYSLLSSFLVGKNACDDTMNEISPSHSLDFPSYQMGITGYVAAYLLVSGNLLLSAPGYTVMKCFGRLVVTMAVVALAVVTNYKQFFEADNRDCVKMLASFLVGVSGAVYVVSIVLRWFTQTTAMYTEMNMSSSETLDMFSIEEIDDKISAGILSIEPPKVVVTTHKKVSGPFAV